MLARLRTLARRSSPVAPVAPVAPVEPVERVGRHRRPVTTLPTLRIPGSVTLVLRDDHELVLDPDSSPARAMTQVATLLAHW